jgi:hypothetical protein
LEEFPCGYMVQDYVEGGGLTDAPSHLFYSRAPDPRLSRLMRKQRANATVVID